MRNIFLDHINREIEHQQAYGNGYIIGKMNALDDIETIQALYSASKAGVQIDLIVRGHCRLRPGLEHYSENIRVISIIGRFLEHSRVYHFNNNGTPTTYIGSADWQRRNLEDRVEAIAPIEEPVLQERITDELKLALSDNRLAWDLQPDGKYIQRKPAAGEPERNLHELLMQKALNEHLL
jgi:polyphosphate kinase